MTTAHSDQDAQRYLAWRQQYHTQLDADGWRATREAWQAASAGGRGDLVHTINDLRQRIKQLEHRAAPWELPEERVAEIIKEPVDRPTEDPHKVARIALDRIRRAVTFIGDPQHPRWDENGSHSRDGSQRSLRKTLDDLLDILDPHRPELDADEVLEDDELWNRVYMSDPVDAYVAQSEKVAIDRANKLEDAFAKMVDEGIIGSETRELLDKSKSAIERLLDEGTFSPTRKGASLVAFAQLTLQLLRRTLS